MSLGWKLYGNLENSLQEFLEDKVSTDDIKDIDGDLVPIRVARKFDKNWSIPTITVFFEAETNVRLEIGSNKRDPRYLIIIDIYASTERERLDLAKWVVDTINDGFRYYSYTPNPSDPANPTKVAGSWVSLDFNTNTRVDLGENVDEVNAHRHRISITTWL